MSRMKIETHRLMVPRSARFVTAGSFVAVEDVWILCHGYGQLASDFLRQARVLERAGRLIVAPEGLSRFYLEDHETIGASWMTREDRDSEMTDYVRYLDLLAAQLFDALDTTPLRVSLLGFSQGVATAARWACRSQPKLDRLVLWGSSLPPELDDEAALAPLKKLRLFIVGGSRDRFLDGRARRRQRRLLDRHRVPFEERTFEGGHRLDDDTLRALANERED
jgi:predicted esterase